MILALLSVAWMAQSTVVRFETNVGVIDIQLYDEETPITVENFLNYVNGGFYNGSVVNKSILVGSADQSDPVQIIQGGGFTWNGSGGLNPISTNPAITNESGISNTAGTIGMARDPNFADSATIQWYFNITNNTSFDPNPNGGTSGARAGYAVFGEVIRGMQVVKNINSFTRLQEFPLYQYRSGTSIDTENIVTIMNAYQLSDEFQVNAGLSGAWFNPATDGQGIYLEVLPDIGQVIMAWFTYDTTDPDLDAPSEVGYAGGRWVTAIGAFDGNEFNGTVYQVDNGLFENSAATVSNTVVGTVNLVFNSCAQLVMSYSLYDGLLNGSSNLQRIAASNIPLCEQLASENNPGIAVQ